MESPPSIWRGPSIRLRALEPEDWEIYAAWNQDDDQALRLEAIPFPRSHAAMRRWAEEESLRHPENDRFRFVIETLAGEAIGDLTTHDCDRRVGTLSDCLNILPTHRRRGYASEAILRLLRYFFRELRYQKATVGIFDFNLPSITLHEHLGFTLEGHLRHMTFSHGHFADLLMYGLTATEFIPLATSRAFPLDLSPSPTDEPASE